MAQSLNELNTIHSKKLATPGRKYYGDDEKVYIGTDSGRLKLENKANEVIFDEQIKNTNVQKKIENLEFDINNKLLLKENIVNKDVDTNLTSNSDTKYTSQKAVKTYIDTNISIIDNNAIVYAIALSGG